MLQLLWWDKVILKKPYAFLIKHFRIIHLIITFFLVATGYMSLRVYNFFNDYVANNYTTKITIGLATDYIPSYLYWMVIAIIALVTILLVLLIHKKKKSILYILMDAYYVIFLIGMIYISSVLRGFEMALLESTAARSIRDILLIFLLPQLVFIVYTSLRSIGFNVRQFNFAKDLKELEYADADAEEVEININFEGYKAKRTARRFIREIIYYVKENKFIVVCIIAVVLVIGGYYLFSHSDANYDANYGVGATFNFQKLQISFKESILTNVDYKGKEITPGKYYLVVKMRVKNPSGDPISLDYNSFALAVGKEKIAPSNNFVRNFIDFENPTIPTLFTPKIEKNMMLVYEIDASLIKKNMSLQIYNGSVYKDGEYFNKNIYVKLKPRIIPKTSLVGNYAISDEVVLADTYLKKTSLVVNGYQITKTYRYKYEVCVKDECKQYDDMLSAPYIRSDNFIIALDTTLYQDVEAPYTSNYKTYHDFAENFIQIKYRVDDKVYEDQYINVTPKENVSFMAFEVLPEIENASVIQAVVNVRNKQYIINLKA